MTARRVETEVKVCASKSNTLEIRIKQEKKQIVRYEEDSEPVVIESSPAPPFPVPHLVLDDIIMFEYNIIFNLLKSNLQDTSLLCHILSLEIETASKAKKEGPGPLHISLDVTLIPQTILESSQSIPEYSPCSICLDDIKCGSEIELECSHVFHIKCLMIWLGWHDTCPLCRFVIEYDP